jgi:hypothetical protein
MQASCVQENPEFTLHDLLRAYAARLAADEEPPEQRRAAQARRFDYYLATAAAGRTPGVQPAARRRPPGPRPQRAALLTRRGPAGFGPAVTSPVRGCR